MVLLERKDRRAGSTSGPLVRGSVIGPIAKPLYDRVARRTVSGRSDDGGQRDPVLDDVPAQFGQAQSVGPGVAAQHAERVEGVPVDVQGRRR
jgi:hypothetical protein